jgi:NAD(P)-dependent dehydrogenase (short-subunit alcohol dehydrogenase family)
MQADKTAIVTGSTSGIGLGIASALASSKVAISPSGDPRMPTTFVLPR